MRVATVFFSLFNWHYSYTSYIYIYIYIYFFFQSSVCVFFFLLYIFIWVGIDIVIMCVVTVFFGLFNWQSSYSSFFLLLLLLLLFLIFIWADIYIIILMVYLDTTCGGQNLSFCVGFKVSFTNNNASEEKKALGKTP